VTNAPYVEVVYALPGRQRICRVAADEPLTVADAIERSGIEAEFPAEDLASARVAVWGRPASRDDTVGANDRVEILRPLLIDPREARRDLAEDGKFMGGQRD